MIIFLIIFPSILAYSHQSTSTPTSSIHRDHFHLIEDYADFEDLLALVEEDIRTHKIPSKPFWSGESRGKIRPSISFRGARQFGTINFDPSTRKRRSEGRFPVGLFPSVIQDSSPSSITVRSGRIFPSPQIVQRFRPPAELPDGQIRVEASSLQSEYPEWLALHAGGSRLHGPIRARSYRELLLHALNRAQAELNRRHRLYSAGGEKRKKKLIDGESRKKKKGREKEKQNCEKCNWRMTRTTNSRCCSLNGNNGKERIREKLKGKSIGEKEKIGKNGRKGIKQGRGKVAGIGATKSSILPSTITTTVPMPTTSTQQKWTKTTTKGGGLLGRMAG